VAGDAQLAETGSHPQHRALQALRLALHIRAELLGITAHHAADAGWVAHPGQPPGFQGISHLHGVGGQLTITLKDEVIGGSHASGSCSTFIEAEINGLHIPQLRDQARRLHF